MVPAALALAACGGNDATKTNGVDGGISGHWMLAAAGLPSEVVQVLAVDPTDPATVYAGLVSDTARQTGSGVYKTGDGGATWTKASAGISVPGSSELPGILSLAIDHLNPQTVYAGGFASLWRSSDGGASWSSFLGAGDASSNPLDLNASNTIVAIDPTSSGGLYVGAHYGLWTTTDGGNSWNEFFQGPPVQPLWFAFDPLSPSKAFTDADGQLYEITGSTQVSSVIPMGPNGDADPGGGTGVFDASGALYTGPWGNWAVHSSPTVCPLGAAGAVIVSSDLGATWSDASTGLPDLCAGGLLALAADPKTPKLAYALEGLYGDGGSAGSFTGRLFRTTDGRSWQEITGDLPPQIQSIAVAPSDGSVIYVGTSDGRVYRSTN
jgi:photosystem II stability/assembly factor-like uncharacterized protein